mgnify:CR=1 FL=1
MGSQFPIGAVRRPSVILDGDAIGVDDQRRGIGLIWPVVYVADAHRFRDVYCALSFGKRKVGGNQSLELFLASSQVDTRPFIADVHFEDLTPMGKRV